MATNDLQRGSATSAPDASADFPVSGRIVFATVVMALLTFGVGGWAAMANLTGAVIAQGTFVVERNVKKVQHSYGGIVSAIHVRNGDRVTAGQPLLQLDATQIRAELEIIRSQILELTVRSGRLSAEGDNLSELTFPEVLTVNNPDAQAAAAGEIRLFQENRRTREGQKEQLRLRIEQLTEEITGLSAQREAKNGELQLITKELDQVRKLHDKQLTSVSRVYAMEREAKRLGGEHGGLTAQIARAKGQISEINVEILSVDANARAQAQRELRAIEGRLAELVEREVAAKDKHDRIELRAPQAGTVHELAVHTIGGIISPAEQIMLIVPDEDDLSIQARISPNDIDQVVIGRPAKLRLSAFNQQTTPELPGRVVHVAADVTVDPKTGETYYLTRLELEQKHQRSVAGLALVPGMPVEVFMSTGDRTALSYLAKPFTDQMNRAFRE